MTKAEKHAAMYQQLEALGEAFGRFDWLLLELDDAEMAATTEFDRAAFPVIGQMILDRGGKTGMKHFIAGYSVGLGLERPDPKRVKYHGPIEETLRKIWTKELEPAVRRK